MSRYVPEPPNRQDTNNAAMWVLVFILVALVAVVLSFALSWLNKGTEVIGPDRIEMLSRQANDHYQSLQSQKASIQLNHDRLAEFRLLYSEDVSTWPQGKHEEYQQLSAAVRNMETAYNLSCGQYNALWQDEWRDLPAPDDLPRRCDLIQ